MTGRMRVRALEAASRVYIRVCGFFLVSVEIAKALVRLRKMLQPTVHVLVPQVLFSYLISTVTRERRSPQEVNRELFRIGVWTGSLAMLKLAKPSDIARFLPDTFDADIIGDGIKLVGSAAWYIFAGHMPTIKTEIKAPKFLWINLMESPGKDAFYKIETAEGVNVWYFLAGAYEGAALTAFRMLRKEELYLAMWRPLPSGNGLEGYYALREVGSAEIARACVDADPEFFSVVSWEDSARFAEELLGVKIPPIP
jgi:hypothetical protein